jgi:hypothetical protein
MKKFTNKAALAVIISFAIVLTSCGGGLKLNVPIEKGSIKDDFTITFENKDITLKPGQFFTLTELGLQENAKMYEGNNILTAYQEVIKKGKHFPSYKIKITKSGYDKPYYGLLAFFKTGKQHTTDAVARYYELQIPTQYFNDATRGRVACAYEYTSDRKFGKVPTWVIWLSDQPL